ncbi:YgaP family membrane protein [Thiorhodococcus fuscus]|uniref:DUF2892 domain-containing protein n=1 Tax=Thiorhodococcus fuscus TaxID=527200 RepID=A0ABW4YER6_9GAMM
MTQNLGKLDRTIRIVGGILLIAWGLASQNWLGAIGLIPLATGLIGWCPAYRPLGLNTNK